MKQVKVEWCENFIRARFTKHHAFPGPNAGIEVNCFWKMAEASGLWERGTYGTPMSKALGNLTTVETIYGEDDKRLFDAFKLKPEQKGDSRPYWRAHLLRPDDGDGDF